MEQLFIRLSSQPHEPLHWLIWSPVQEELIASGTLNDLSELSQLSDHARSREVICFAPGTDVLITAVELPNSAMRMLSQVIPNALEDELAQDISELHFAWPPVKKSGTGLSLHVAVVAHEAMTKWLQALDAADIECDEMYPDIFMVPAPQEGGAVPAPEQGLHPTSLTLGETVIIRTGQYSGFSTDIALLPVMAEGMQLQAVEQMDIEVPLSIVATTYNARKSQPEMINLRQHQYRVQRKKRKGASNVGAYKPAAIAAAVLLAVGYSSQVVEYVQLGEQSAQLEQAIEQTYRDTFPNEKRIVNVRSQLNRHLESLGVEGVTASPLELLAHLEPAFKANRDVRLEMLRFENETLRMQVKANSFGSLENFRKVANEGGQVTVEQGPVNNQSGAVSGALTVKKDV
ncbi:type II secretion system protein GspL [Pseudidiomarina gelatinasegens]|uniref:Type II secretion system protein L n=1 Tax=Pseudidiomarina gelatinasegens TaxID=2487740 RepID=A0A443Z7U9_9GAMM|nr:type II secretion system protein GspL [Pseudidiomarina gelatinasegens]RWU12965.1 type II secretion system protein GspL [Pseudidiomarina gelatinasegens]